MVSAQFLGNTAFCVYSVHVRYRCAANSNLACFITVKIQKVSRFRFCSDLLYFVVFFCIRYRLNAIKYIFRTIYHRKTLTLLKHIISKTIVAIFADKSLLATGTLCILTVNLRPHMNVENNY